MCKKLVFVESTDELGYLDVLTGDVSVVTTQPAVEVELNRRGIPCRNSREFFGKEGHEQVIHLTAAVVGELRPAFRTLSLMDVEHVFERNAIFYIRFYLNYLFSHLIIVHQAVQLLKPDRLVVFPSVPFQHLDALLPEKLPLMGNVIELYGTANGLSLQFIDQTTHSIHPKPRKELPAWLKQMIFKGIVAVYRVRCANSNVLLAPGDAYGMSSLLDSLTAEIDGALPVFLSVRRASAKDKFKEMLLGRSFSFPGLPDTIGKEENRQFGRKWSVCRGMILKGMQDHPGIYSLSKVDLRQPIMDFLDHAMVTELRRLAGKICSLKKVFLIHQPTAVFAQHALGVSYALGEISRAKSVPAMLVSHGSHVPHPNEVAEIEWSEHARTLMDTHFPFVAVQTQWAAKFLQSNSEGGSRQLVTGPLLFAQPGDMSVDWDAMRKRVYGTNADKHILLHAGTPKSWRSFRPWVYETIDEYIENINRLIKATEQVSGIHLAIRFRPVNGLTLEQVKKLLVDSDCYGIYSEGSFEEHLLPADMLVSYSSTTLEEALQNRIPILQFDPDAKYWHIPCGNHQESETVQKRAVQCASSHEELISLLNELVAGNFSNIAESEWSQHILAKNPHWLEKMLGDRA